MLCDLINYLRNKKILVWGFGAEGQSSVRLFHRHFPSDSLVVTDSRPSQVADHLGGAGRVEIWSESEAVARAHEFDLVLKSPGISARQFGIVGKRASQICLRGQADLFLQFMPCRTIGVTGTKGKSTTASLLAHLLSSPEKKVPLAGNIGLPPWEIVEDLRRDSLCVLELSSYQLERSTCSPSVAVLLNLYQEHLNYHGTLENYWEAKWNIVAHQRAGQIFVYSGKSQPIVERLGRLLPGVVAHPFDADESAWRSEASQHPRLRGEHNLRNLQAAATVARHLGVNPQTIRERLPEYGGLPHRLELVGTIGGVTYYNDSISTVPESAMAGLEAIPETQGILLGGQNRGVSYAALAQRLRHSTLDWIFLYSETGRVIADLLAGDPRIRWVENLSEAVTLAKGLMKPSGACLFSPAAPSYNQFRNFEERGEEFKRLVSKYTF